jgi:hypothetical protein
MSRERLHQFGDGSANGLEIEIRSDGLIIQLLRKLI